MPVKVETMRMDLSGFLVGLISSIVVGLVGGALTMIMGIIILGGGALTAVEWVIGTFIRMQMDK